MHPVELAAAAGKCGAAAISPLSAISQSHSSEYAATAHLARAWQDPGFKASNGVAIAWLATLPSQACCPNAEARVGLVDGLDLAVKLCDEPCSDLRSDGAERSAR